MLPDLPHDVDLVLRDPLAAARASGRPIIGFMSNNVPVELIHAAGGFPLQLPTAPRSIVEAGARAEGSRTATPRADRYLEPRFDPLVRSALEWLLEGHGRALAAVILPRANDSMQRLYYYLCELRRLFAEPLPEPLLYDVLHTPWYASASHNHARTEALAAQLGALTGHTASEADLRASCALYDQVRARVDAVLARRRLPACALSGERARALLVAAQRLAPETLQGALDAVLAAPPEHAPGVRTLLTGSAHDTPALHRLIAAAGGQVVADRHWLGDGLFGPPLDARLPPLRALTAHYHRDSLSARTFPPSPGALVRAAEEARAEAVVFSYHAEEEALTWDHQAEQSALEDRGIPTLLLAKQPYPATEASTAALHDFFVGVAARSAHG